MSSFTSNTAGIDHYQLNKLYRNLASERIDRQEFVQQLESLGYVITPSLYRLLNQQRSLKYADLIKALRNTTIDRGRTAPTVRVQAAANAQRLDQDLYHPSYSTHDTHRGGEGHHGGHDNILDVLQEDRRGSYNATVQNQSIGGAEVQVMKELRKMLLARGALEQATDFLNNAPLFEGVHIDIMVKKFKALGVFLERGEIKTLQKRFPTRYRSTHVDGAAISGLLSHTVLDAPSKGRPTTYIPTTNGKPYDPNSNGNFEQSGRGEAYSIATSSVPSSATNGTANHIPGHMATAQSFSQVQDEYILVRMLKNICKDGKVSKLRRLRIALNRAGAAHVDAAQEPRAYSAEVNGRINFYTFKSVLNEFVPSVPESDLMAVFDNLYPDIHNYISCATFYYRLRGSMSKHQVEAVDQVFRGLLLKSSPDISVLDEVPISVILDNYTPRRDPEVINGHAEVQDKTSEILDLHQFSTSRSTVARKGFFDFFGDLSSCKPNNDDFLSIMHMPWYKVLTVHDAQYPSGERPIGFHRALREHHTHSTKKISTAVRRVLQRIVHDASWSPNALKNLYDKFDTDGDGSVTATEFCRFFAHLRIRITADEMDELMEYLDTDGDGCISFEEFIAVVHANDYLEQTTGYMGVAVPPREAARNLPTKSTTRVMVSEESKAHIRHQLEHIRQQLNSDKEFGFRGFGQLLVAYDHVTSNISPWVTRAQFEAILSESGVSLRKTAIYDVFNVFQAEHAYQDMLHWWQFLDCVSYEWNDRRRHITHRAFKAVDLNSDGEITVQEMAAGFRAEKHPAAQNGANHHILKDAFFLLLGSIGSRNAPINAKQWSKLLRYTMSACEESDEEYEKIMNAVWKC